MGFDAGPQWQWLNSSGQRCDAIARHCQPSYIAREDVKAEDDEDEVCLVDKRHAQDPRLKSLC